MKSWIGVFGTMNAVLSDNGGEFNNELIREVASMLGVELLTTAAYSPWSNGLCERVHAVIDTIIAKLREENPGRDLETLLRWANFAKNSLHMNNEGMLVLWVEGLTGLGITSICCHKPCEQSQLTDQQGPSESYRTRAVSPQAWVR